MSSEIGNIFGEGFPKKIVDQVTNRQKIYSSGFGSNRTLDEIKYLNANTAFIRLMSATDVTDIKNVGSKVIQDLGLSGNALAKKFMLLGGISEYLGGIITGSAGISFGNTLSGNNSAYGMGGNEFGIRPMPGIISATINHENRGSLRRADVKIKAFNRAQFEILDILYLRLGYHILLEWGHSVYADSGGAIVEMNGQESLDTTFLNGAKDYAFILKKIAENRLTYAGNYDAMLGRVTNFQWTFNPDGSYDITLKIASIGDIIESLKANILLETAGEFTSLKDEKKEDQDNINELETRELIEKFSSKHTIGAFLYFMKFYLSDATEGLIPRVDYIPDFIEDIAASTVSSQLVASILVTPQYEKRPEDYAKYRSRVLDLTKLNPATIASSIEVINKVNGIVEPLNDVLIGAIAIAGGASGATFAYYLKKQNSQLINKLPSLANIDPNAIKKDPSEKHYDALMLEWDNWGNEYYVRLGTFLEFIEKVILIQSVTGTTRTPLLKFDTNSKKNIMFAPKAMISVDPRICVVNRISVPGNPPLENAPGADEFICYTSTTNNDYGDLMNIYLNFSFILRKIDELKDDQGKITLIDLLQGLLKGVNTAFSGIPDLDVFIDETTNTVKIIDKNPLPDLEEILNKEKLSNEKAIFSLYGYNNINGTNQAGFIYDFNLTTELTPAFSTVITVGAAANSAVVGENDTALSKLNIGLTDRYKEVVENGSYTDKKNQAADLKKTIADLEDKYKKIIKEYIAFLTELSPTYGTTTDDLQELNSEDVDVYKDTLKTLYDIINQIAAGKAKLANTFKTYQPKGTGFIPINLSLTMNGLSGMKINQQFFIETDFLPSNYPDAVRFLIKNLSHTIENNRWITKMESYCIANGKEEKINITPAFGAITTNTGTGGTGGGGTGGGGNGEVPSSNVSGSDCDNSPIRQAIVKKAYSYLNMNIAEVYQDKSFNNPDFEKQMRSVQWNNNAWCNFFADLVWREAYKEVGANDPVINNVFQTTLKGKVIPPLTGQVYYTADAAQKAGFGTVWLTQGKTYPGEKSINVKGYGTYYGITRLDPRFEMPRPGDMVIYASGHVNIAVEVDYKNKTWVTIGGNEGYPGNVKRSTWWGGTSNNLIYGIVRVIDPNCNNNNNNNNNNIKQIGGVQSWAKDKDFIDEVKRICKAYNINPRDLLAVFYSESTIRPDIANEYTGASGIFQLMPGIAEGFNKQGANIPIDKATAPPLPPPLAEYAKLPKNKGITGKTLEDKRNKEVSAHLVGLLATYRTWTRTEQIKLFEKYKMNKSYKNASAGKLYAFNWLPARATNPLTYGGFTDVVTYKGELWEPGTKYAGSLKRWYESNSGLDTNKDGIATIADLDARLARIKIELEKQFKIAGI